MIMFLRFMRSQKNLVSRYVQYLWKLVTVCFFALKKVKYSRENRIKVHYSLAQPQPQLMLQFVFSGVFLSITTISLNDTFRNTYLVSEKLVNIANINQQ